MNTCPVCLKSENVIKKGFYLHAKKNLKVQRYYCKSCHKKFSNQTSNYDYHLSLKPKNQFVFRMLSQGMSQRAIARNLGISRGSVARRVIRYGLFCEAQMLLYRQSRKKCTNIQFDELETYEHTKCKPITVPIAVESKTRKILAVDAGDIAAKGKIAKQAKQKYGKRVCQRRETLQRFFKDLKVVTNEKTKFLSDSSTHYVSPMKKFFPDNPYFRVLGRRGCIVGQGELKAGGFDPLFTLNHTYAMFRDNIKRLTRRTWCTTKVKACLKKILYIYAWYHNTYLDGGMVFLKRHQI